MDKFPLKIAICSKGRGGSQVKKDGNITYQALNPGKIYKHAIENDIHELDNVYLFIEPNDVESYTATYSQWPKKNIIVLGDNSQGLAFTRQTALLYFQETEPQEMICMLDDDALIFEHQWGWNEKKQREMWNKVERPIVEALNDCATYLKSMDEYDKCGIMALEYNHFSWTKEHAFPKDGSWRSKKFSDIGSNHSYCDCIVFWKPLLYKELGIEYDNYPLKADRDFAFQVAFKQLYNRKIFKFIMDSPLNGKAAGGCQDWYHKQDQERNECLDLVEKWAQAGHKLPMVEFKEKETKYGRDSDVKWQWTRAYYGRIRGDYPKDATVPIKHPLPESVHNYKRLSEIN